MYFRASKVVANKSNAGNRKTIARPYIGKKVFIKSGEPIFVEHLINEIKHKNNLDFDDSPQEIMNRLRVWINAIGGTSFTSLLGYNAILEENGDYNIGYKIISSFDARIKCISFPICLNKWNKSNFCLYCLYSTLKCWSCKGPIHKYASMIQTDATKSGVPAVLNLIIDQPPLN